MDRISALRNVERALAAYEAGERSLPELEREVRGVLRSYATEYGEGSAWRARGDERVDGLVVVAPSRSAARERVAAAVDEPVTVEVDPLEEPETDDPAGSG
jgi:hypothetical protein